MDQGAQAWSTCMPHPDGEHLLFLPMPGTKKLSDNAQEIRPGRTLLRIL
jgi:hypothetical protein